LVKDDSSEDFCPDILGRITKSDKRFEYNGIQFVGGIYPREIASGDSPGGYMNLGKAVIVFSIICLITLAPQIHVYAQLPQDLVNKLHSQLIVAMLSAPSSFREIVSNYYRYMKIGNDQLYDLSPYDVLMITTNLDFTTEQINSIVNFVNGGGGLIIISYGGSYSGSVDLLLSKLGIRGVYLGYLHEPIIVYRDGKSLLDHPITTSVEALRIDYGRITTGVNATVKVFVIMDWPAKILAWEYGSGRIVLVGSYDMDFSTLSGPRLAVNMIEWVAGYTPPGWEPPTYNKTFITVTQTATITETITNVITTTSVKTSTVTLVSTVEKPTTITTIITSERTVTIPPATSIIKTERAVEWTVTGIVAVVLIVIGFLIGYMIKKR